jgi:hypothetical protein
VLLCTLVALRASAGPGPADQATAAANAAAAKHDFTTAATRFREAYAADPRPELMCNVGIAYYKAKDLPRAERYLDQCELIGKALEPGFLASVAKVHAALVAKLAAGRFTPVDFAVEPPTASLAVVGGVPYDEPFVGARRVWFPFGTYRVSVHAEGYTDQIIDVDARDRAARPVKITLAPEPAAGSASEGSAGASSAAAGSAAAGSAAEGSAAEAAGSGSTAVPSPPAPPLVLAHRSRVPAIAASGATVALGATSIALWRLAISRANRAGTRSDPTLYEADVDSARSWQKTSWIAGGVAGVAALVSAYLWYRSSGTTRVNVEATGSSAAVSFSAPW